ncbi:hypothetical protein LTR70_009965 [Exophiala xenobiotica]|uniref:PH domain-containing protein n=1 Tax=Lithohypha guttulata TaxID=1690604 RepID=A0ABR0K072_9EURO|nr:hypothetical protein LTR24_008354 [Lithohypha guttulata]KAK5309821.1 hypothetical protein LTR70_009965 [Exophiala xenobiotica]
MPLAPPPHEQRERWMTAILASYGNATIWRYVRDRLVETNQLRTQLELGTQKLTRTIDEFWLGPRIIAIWGRISHRVNKLYFGWQSILDWLEDRKWTNPDFRPEKEQVIKVLAVLNHYTSAFQQLYQVSFDVVFECFRRHRRVTARKPPKRRWSTGNEHLCKPRIFKNRYYYERMLHLYAQRMEASCQFVQRDTQVLYNSSKLFEHLVTDIQENNKKQEEWWAAWGRRYPWPSCQLKSIGGRNSSIGQDHALEYGVPSWEEDEELREVFA